MNAATPRLPSVDKLLHTPALQALQQQYGTSSTTDAVRQVLEGLRPALRDGSLHADQVTETALVQATEQRLTERFAPRLRSVFNLTGTVLHTNLGRALLPQEAVDAVVEALTNPANLEYDLDTGGRGDRDDLVEQLVCELTGAEAATIVNNNAAAVLLALSTLAAGQEVVVSRGELGCHKMVLWLAREGTYIREAKNARLAHEWLMTAINKSLAHDKKLRILIEPKPNEPMDHAYVPTIGHAIAMAYASDDPKRMGGLIETAHAKLAGLDPSDEMAFALYHKKLWSVHLNDQNGLKFDEDKNFAAANLREAFNQVRVLDEAGYGRNGEWVGLDVKVMRTQKQERNTAHLANSKRFFKLMLEKVRTFDRKAEAELIKDRDYEGLERLVIEHLLGVK